MQGMLSKKIPFWGFVLCFAGLCVGGSPALFAQGPDVIVGSLPNTNAYGTSPGTNIYAYSVATTSCNIGTANLAWQANNNNHPVIGQDMWRLHDGRFTQIGNSWLKHGFCALQNTGLCPGCSGGGGCLSFLTPGCADPYSAGLNGSQGGLGPRSEVNATTGFFPYPFGGPPNSNAVIGRRVQVHVDDITATSFPGALYFVSGHYVAADDAAFGNQANNASYRQVTVAQNGNRDLNFVGGTQQEQPPIQAWQDNQPTVTLVDLQAPGDGLFILGYDVIDNGNGTWRYEYALYNMYSDRSARSFFVPIPNGASVTDIGFRDNPWHSGDERSTTDWSSNLTQLGLTWETQTFAQNVDANACRWGQLFNFWFTCDAAPTDNTASMEFFKPGTPTQLDFTVSAPSGNFLPSVDNLTCVQMSPTAGAVSLNWTNGTAYDSIIVRRDGQLLATLGGGSTSYNDMTSGFGTFEYTVQGTSGASLTFQVPCIVDVAPAPATGVSCFQDTLATTNVNVSWTNGMAYDSIIMYVDGSLNTTLPGSSTTHTVTGLSLGFHTIQVAGVVTGIETDRADCIVEVLATPAPNFTFQFDPAAGTYDPTTGIGSVAANFWAQEDPTSFGFPHEVQGWSLSAAFDPAVLDIAQIDASALMSTADFFNTEFVSNGFTIGAVISFSNLTTISLNGMTDLATINLDTNSGALIGNTSGATTTLSFQDGLGSGFPVDNLVVYDNGTVRSPIVVNGAITLTPLALDVFRRGDTNNDSLVNIADGIALLAYLFQMGPATCLDALEVNDDGLLNIADGISILGFLFTMGPPPAAPFPGCGSDPTSDSVECDSYNGSC